MVFLLLTVLIVTNWYHISDKYRLYESIDKKNKKIDELQALRDSDNIRFIDMVNNNNSRIQEEIENCAKENLENLKSYMDLRKKYDELYSLTLNRPQ
ncbi:hypothetical protein [Abyssalbus ytuae]|uniref:Uncharacterized protein n=1 Tax=Abyssalbus ytuae TaxID=2926907 RepID=A0A9E6ZZ95_9FLAO|nr:hypothetical protein [Abyssalbus ytuae]UOB16596.1 hypothetical protein MQE35_12725 [Abyssalbus ytuae]